MWNKNGLVTVCGSVLAANVCWVYCFFYSFSAVIACFMVSTDFSKRCWDSCESLSSIILSAPFFPRTTGTPMETAEQLYSPCGHVETLMTRFLPWMTASAIMAMTAAGA